MNIESLNAQLLENQELTPDTDADQYLSFEMAGEEYGIDILTVQEIRGWEQTTSIPNSPDYIKGVMNLRGTIVPVLDLRSKFGLPSVAYTPVTVVIILTIEQDNTNKTIGIVVDAVSDVYAIDNIQLKVPPSLEQNKNRQYIKGLAQVDESTLILLNLNQVL
ncbi:chemotaxis protein CheW [Catenovulum sp. 2E275]|nr:chemotaxis protein CheW [Catenovulum sp. 2E275]MCU4674423.1 chemotaxis protein CheW [Catenovulum sp. 2E275]